MLADRCCGTLVFVKHAFQTITPCWSHYKISQLLDSQNVCRWNQFNCSLSGSLGDHTLVSLQFCSNQNYFSSYYIASLQLSKNSKTIITLFYGLSTLQGNKKVWHLPSTRRSMLQFALSAHAVFQTLNQFCRFLSTLENRKWVILLCRTIQFIINAAARCIQIMLLLVTTSSSFQHLCASKDSHVKLGIVKMQYEIKKTLLFHHAPIISAIRE